jgi:hypothetical protein
VIKKLEHRDYGDEYSFETEKHTPCKYGREEAVDVYIEENAMHDKFLI